MKAIVHDQLGPAESVLRLVDREVPEPGAGEVRIRVTVSGVNPTDWKARTGLYGGEVVESVPNQDGAGVVDAVGPDVDGLAVGDRVWLTLAAYLRPGSGTAQEYTVVPAERVFPLPGDASFELGASIGVPAITAHRALTVAEDGPTRLAPGALDGKVILVAGGAGAVGHAAIQLARWAGATVIATVGSAAKAGYPEAAGAQYVVNYNDADAGAQIRGFAPDGVDLVVEVAIGANAELDLEVLRPLGTIAIYANNGDKPFAVDIRQNMGLNARYQYVLLYTVGWDKLTAAAEDINAAIEAGALPVGEDAGLPLHHFTLDRTAEAHQAVESGATGKVLIDVS
ncbi:NADPH2:quinone reductase [Kribbella orskensis]|uniref:NADPH2:quinone reductase n=1 Tax=Kribbella orskensis TaxID=2512216 RepID=A0ABY2B731_9ACTN|nr:MULTISPECIES: NADPH:quinone reductase [Kribbella]TCN29672.1 NADPH2:quinone reductase [Kribbella sp. VKM Ac-2500]TCO10053.1 NADPH2:quinone reductase [Kribbella orskensis]